MNWLNRLAKKVLVLSTSNMCARLHFDKMVFRWHKFCGIFLWNFSKNSTKFFVLSNLKFHKFVMNSTKWFCGISECLIEFISENLNRHTSVQKVVSQTWEKFAPVFDWMVDLREHSSRAALANQIVRHLRRVNKRNEYEVIISFFQLC